MGLKGTDLVMSVATTTGGAYNTVLGMKDASMSMKGDNQDISTFGTDYIKRLQGLKDVTYSLSGFVDLTDTTGQTIIRTALTGDTALFFKFLPDGTNGWKQEVKVASFDMSAAVDGVVELSIELEGSDAITVIP